MAWTGSTPRKRRTRQHIIAAQSANYVERFIIDEGHTAQRLEHDYGYDLTMISYDEQGYVEPGWVYLQLKAAETLAASGSDYLFDLDVRDYNLWIMEIMPVILVLYEASRRKAYWLYVQRYFRQDLSRRPQKAAKRIRIRVPRRQTVSGRAVAQWCHFKQMVLDRPYGVMHDA